MAAVKLLFDTDPALAVARPNATQDPVATPAVTGPTESASAPVQPPPDNVVALKGQA
jgi:hypothetical protein